MDELVFILQVPLHERNDSVKKMISTVVGLAALGLVATAAQAKVSAAEAAKLGTSLTCVGAEKGANADGSIPAFSGKWLGTPPGLTYKPNVGQHHPDPYASEQPKFVVTAANMAQYAAHLTDGQEKMLKKYPTFKIPVYATHRDFRMDDSVCAVSKKNAESAELSANGLDGKGFFYGGVPFPIPKTGLEVLYNAMSSRRSYTAVANRDTAVVSPTGNKYWSQSKFTSFVPANSPAFVGKPVDTSGDAIAAYVKAQMLKPAQSKGLQILVKEPVTYSRPRLTWLYEPGTRRVRQAPEFGFDQPLEGTFGAMTIDEDGLFNGSPERYNFKLLGKKEIFIPSNSYKVNSNAVKYDALLTPNHANPDFIRYELRRVWVIEGTLKPGYRHIYAKRVMYIDEDSWNSTIADYYDGRGDVYKHNFINWFYAFDLKSQEQGVSFYHDLTSGKYVAYNLFQQMPNGPILNKGGMSESEFTTTVLGQSGS